MESSMKLRGVSSAILLWLLVGFATAEARAEARECDAVKNKEVTVTGKITQFTPWRPDPLAEGPLGSEISTHTNVSGNCFLVRIYVRHKARINGRYVRPPGCDIGGLFIANGRLQPVDVWATATPYDGAEMLDATI